MGSTAAHILTGTITVVFEVPPDRPQGTLTAWNMPGSTTRLFLKGRT